MYITGYRDSNDTRYYIPVRVYSKYYSKYYFDWNFLIDTGAEKTQLSWNDAAYYGITIRMLPPDNKTFIGLGGTVHGYLLPESTLIFKINQSSDVGIHRLFVGDLSVTDFETTSGNKCPRGSSVLGIDILDQFDILFEPKSDVVFLSREI